MATLSSILAQRIPWTEDPGGLPSIGLQRVRHGWSDLAHVHTINSHYFQEICSWGGDSLQLRTILGDKAESCQQNLSHYWRNGSCLNLKEGMGAESQHPLCPSCLSLLSTPVHSLCPCLAHGILIPEFLVGSFWQEEWVSAFWVFILYLAESQTHSLTNY